MALNYTYLKYKDTYTLKNNGAVDLTYHISTVTCETTAEVKTGVIIPNQTVVLTFAVDGKYSVYLSSSTETSTPFIIKYYNNLLTSLISMTEQTVCGCGKCKDCEECNQCEDYLGTFMKAQAFNTVNYPIYQTAINQVTENNACLYTQEVLCSLLHEKVYGTVETKDTMLIIIGSYYLSFYYQDKFLAVDQEEKDYVTSKYKFDKIGSCLKKKGLTLTEPACTTTEPPVTTCPPTTTSTTTCPPATTSTTLNPCLLIVSAQEINSTTSTSTSTTSTTTEPPQINSLTGIIINDPEDSGKVTYSPSYNYTSHLPSGDWYYNSEVILTVQQPSLFQTNATYLYDYSSPQVNDMVMLRQDFQSFLPNDIVFNPALGNKMWYLISSVEYTSAQISTILANATQIQNIQLLPGNPPTWEGDDFLYDVDPTQSSYAYLIWDYRKVVATTTTTSTTSTTTTTTTATPTTTTTIPTTTIPTTTTTTTACVNRPTGLTNGRLILAVNNPGDPSRYFANVSVVYACETFNYFRAVPMASGTGTSNTSMQYSSLTIGQKIYAGNDETNCNLVPTNYYWFQPDITSPAPYFKGINQINIVTVVSGVITAIDVCDYVPPTTTTTTTL